MRKWLLIVFILVCLHTPAHAQNYNFGCSTLTRAEDKGQVSTISSYTEPAASECNDTAPQGTPAVGSTAPEDNTYEDLCLRQKEVQGARPQVCQVHRRMPATRDEVVNGVKISHTVSPLNLNPWYLISMQDPAKPFHPYLGPLYRGESNYAQYNSRLSQVDPVDTVLGCIPQIKPITGGVDPYDPLWMRAERDNCANQYILSRARYARFAEEIEPDANGRGDKPLPVSADQASSLCQPLRLIPMPASKQEYVPADYMLEAWKKLLFKESSTMRKGKAQDEPLYSRIGVKIVDGKDGDPDNRIAPPTKGVSPFRCSNASKQGFGKVCLNGITETQVERILDPSHPFSPRWDTRGNDRDTYSPWTISYTQDPMTILYGVRCAGDNKAKYYKVDMLPWRQKTFQKGIMRRLLWNIICKYTTVTIVFVTWECWDGSIAIFGAKVVTDVPWNCEDNRSGGGLWRQ